MHGVENYQKIKCLCCSVICWTSSVKPARSKGVHTMRKSQGTKSEWLSANSHGSHSLLFLRHITHSNQLSHSLTTHPNSQGPPPPLEEIRNKDRKPPLTVPHALKGIYKSLLATTRASLSYHSSQSTLGEYIFKVSHHKKKQRCLTPAATSHRKRPSSKWKPSSLESSEWVTWENSMPEPSLPPVGRSKAPLLALVVLVFLRVSFYLDRIAPPGNN